MISNKIRCFSFELLNLQSPEVSYSELVFSGGSLGAPPAPQNCSQKQHRGGTEYALIMPQTSKQHQLQTAANLPIQPNKQATILPRPRRPEEVQSQVSFLSYIIYHLSVGSHQKAERQ